MNSYLLDIRINGHHDLSSPNVVPPMNQPVQIKLVYFSTYFHNLFYQEIIKNIFMDKFDSYCFQLVPSDCSMHF